MRERPFVCVRIFFTILNLQKKEKKERNQFYRMPVNGLLEAPPTSPLYRILGESNIEEILLSYNI